MSKKISERIPREVGKGALPDHPAIKSPWDKLYSFHDCYHFAVRHNSVFAAAYMDVMRILVPDYDTRVRKLVESTEKTSKARFSPDGPFNKIHKEKNNDISPFCSGGWMAGCYGDTGDERLLMCGRLNDAGPYRCEKELDVCAWDIVGSEICKCSAHNMTAIGSGYPGPEMEFQFYEGRGYGHLHCRAIGENRDKYPVPKHDDITGEPVIATEEMIHYTPREKMYKEPQFFREECGYKTTNAFNKTATAAEQYPGGVWQPLGTDYCTDALVTMIKNGELEESVVLNVVECVFRACGKMMFCDFYAKKGVRDWMGVPGDLEDGRVLGGYIEMLLQMLQVPYEIQAFNEEEVIYDIDFKKFERMTSYLVPAYLAFFYGMCRTLVNAEWFCWRETEGVSEDILRLKIGKKIDFRCL